MEAAGIEPTSGVLYDKGYLNKIWFSLKYIFKLWVSGIDITICPTGFL